MPTITDLRKTYRDETLHSDYVAQLALQLFDSLRGPLECPRTDRRLLQAAAKLHDIGFAVAPTSHPLTGAKLVLQHGICGFAPDEVQAIATAIALHGSARLQSSSGAGLALWRAHDRATRLAAILRVADGLDHGHIQDAVIKDIQFRGHAGVHVYVSSVAYPKNIPSANKKADLWNHTLPVQIEFRARHARRQEIPYFYALNSQLNAWEVFRRLLCMHYRMAGDAYKAAVSGADHAALHDLRVGIRRFRTTLQLFEPHLPSCAKKLERSLAQLSARLGPFRDWEVWADFLRLPEVAAEIDSLPAGKKWRQRVLSVSVLRQAHLRRLLRKPDVRACFRRMAYFARVKAPLLADPTQPIPAVNELTAERLKQLWRRILKASRLTKTARPEEVHRLRKLARKGRYLCEFTGPVLGSPISKWAILLKRLADTLGDWHDLQTHAARLADERTDYARKLRAMLARRQRKVRAAYSRLFALLNKKSFQKRIKKSLKKLT